MSDQFLLIQQGIIGSVVPFLTKWLKEKWPRAFAATPIQSMATAWVLVVLCTWAACTYVGDHCTWQQIQQYAMGTALVQQAVHALLKTDPTQIGKDQTPTTPSA